MTETAKRILMGMVMAVVAICAILFLPQIYFFLAIACVLMLTGYEWIGLITTCKRLQMVYLIALALALLSVFWIMFMFSGPLVLVGLSLLAMVIGIVQLFVFAAKPQSRFVQNKFLRVILSLILLMSAQCFLALLRYHGNFWIVYVIALVAMFDTGAYFAGRALGKHPLAKRLSPKKTWEGFVGGCVLGILLSIALMICMHTVYPIGMGTWVFIVIMTIIMAIFSVFGDLFESMQKRIAGKKDSSNIIPGHGGFFDRIDALLFVLPIMFVYRDILVFLMNRAVLFELIK